MDIFRYNTRAWDSQVDRKNQWTIPVSAEEVACARGGELNVILTPLKIVPRAWFPSGLSGVRILGLACGGGQQGPLFAAAGADVTIYDASAAQLGQDRAVAKREGLTIRTVQGDMADLSAFDDESFDLVFHPCSNCFARDIEPVWREAFRVLRPGGELLTGFVQPHWYLFDEVEHEKGRLVVRHRLPFDEARDLTDEERETFISNLEPLLHGHTLDAQLGGQMRAGFLLVDMYEDKEPKFLLSKYIDSYMATRARRPASTH
ncbi:MAG TPA: class I SAM-dependent methyltransferase [Candidatus Krumholzibacteria bacterium]|jgi:SAM-dependent methyltransferase